MEIRPTKAEELFLSLAYNRFYDLYEEVMKDDFWDKEPWYLLAKYHRLLQFMLSC